MSDKASCFGALDVRALQFEEDTAKNGEKQEEMNIEVPDYSKLELPSSLQSLSSYVESTLKPQEKAMTFTIEKEVFGIDRNTFVLHEDITQFASTEEIGATVVAVYMRCLFDHLKVANMVNMVGFIDPALVSADAGSLTERSRLVANRLQKTNGEQIFLMPYNLGRHWVLIIVRAKKEAVYFLDPLPGNQVVDEDGKNIVNSALKMFAKGKDQAPYPQEAIEEVRKEWAEFVCVHME
ncbi:hypothetical protein ACE6H2_001868 [Prunus campanulata]